VHLRAICCCCCGCGVATNMSQHPSISKESSQWHRCCSQCMQREGTYVGCVVVEEEKRKPARAEINKGIPLGRSNRCCYLRSPHNSQEHLTSEKTPCLVARKRGCALATTTAVFTARSKAKNVSPVRERTAIALAGTSDLERVSRMNERYSFGISCIVRRATRTASPVIILKWL
jgi:hypothetical protein